MNVLSAISLMSAPAANAFSLPVISMQPMFVVRFECIDGLREFADQRAVERVQRLRPVEPDDADAALRFDDDVFVSHDVPITPT